MPFDMPLSKFVILALLIMIAVTFAIVWGMALTRRSDFKFPTALQAIIGFVTDFLDTMAIGSFATTTALFRFFKVVDDQKIPGTLNVGHALPTILQALLAISVIEVDLWTLWLLIGSSVLGSYIGALFVSRLPKRGIQIGMAVALTIAGSVIAAKLLGWFPQEKQVGLTELTGIPLIIGMIGNFIFGAMMMIGVGAYAPIMVMVSLLGMNTKAAFPIMMGSCAFLMPVASYRFVKSGSYDARAALGLAIFGLPGVALCAYFIDKADTNLINKLVLIVVAYTVGSLLYSALKPKTEKAESIEASVATANAFES